MKSKLGFEPAAYNEQLLLIIGMRTLLLSSFILWPGIVDYYKGKDQHQEVVHIISFSKKKKPLC